MATRGTTARTTFDNTQTETTIGDYGSDGDGIVILAFTTVVGVLKIKWLDDRGGVRACSALQTSLSANDTEIVNIQFPHPAFRLTFTAGAGTAGVITTEVKAY